MGFQQRRPATGGAFSCDQLSILKHRGFLGPKKPVYCPVNPSNIKL
jgi:hypothetical protein